MNVYANVLLFVLCGHLFRGVESDRLIAINSASSVRKLYKRIGNGDAPSPESDPACVDADIRKRICDEITHSGYFVKKRMHPIVIEPDILSSRLKDDELFSRIYEKIEREDVAADGSSSSISNFLSSFRSPRPTFEYQNLFTPREFRVSDSNGAKMPLLEHVIVCLLRDFRDGQIHPYYVSKEYNVVGDPFRAGRFIFTERGVETSPYFFTDMLLAEAPAKVFVDRENPEYNVELKYLERRQDLPLGKDFHIFGGLSEEEIAEDEASDPVCKLLSLFEPDSEQDRLCAMVMNSSDFQGTTVGYPESWYLAKCAEIKVYFRTEEGKRLAGEKEYRERALRCYCRNSAHHDTYDYFYITRAYAPNEVFVLEQDFAYGRAFLKNLTIDVGIVRDGVTAN